MKFLQKYKHYIPLLFFAIVQISFNIISILKDAKLSHGLYALVQLGLAISFVYVLTKEAKKFQAKGKYGTVYRLMFAAGFACCAFLFSALRRLLAH
jgi:hypothetical protein